ncbi:g8627 [Coccomyxa viridis]|uniref:G8627 protein n=1 Tax=Coccomyxa viridis TaxID=1274662 RepID=A0ABP1G0T6_9CHLO
MNAAEVAIKIKRSEPAVMSRWSQTKDFPRFPKSALHEFHQVHGGNPVFVIEDGPPPPASPKFTCHLTIPALSTPHGGYEQQSFSAVARAKKAAEHAAAEMALEFITTSGVASPAMPALPSMLGSSVTREEVWLLQQRLHSLDRKLAAERSRSMETPGSELEVALTARSNSSLEPQPRAKPGAYLATLGEVDLSALRAELTRAREANSRLRRELQLLQQRREIVVGALVGSA